jgi:hypothetical protein
VVVVAGDPPTDTEDHRAEPPNEFGERGLIPGAGIPSEKSAVGRSGVGPGIDGPTDPGNTCREGGVWHGFGSWASHCGSPLILGFGGSARRAKNEKTRPQGRAMLFSDGADRVGRREGQCYLPGLVGLPPVQIADRDDPLAGAFFGGDRLGILAVRVADHQMRFGLFHQQFLRLALVSLPPGVRDLSSRPVTSSNP